jgi:hypothetical protein
MHAHYMHVKKSNKKAYALSICLNLVKKFFFCFFFVESLYIAKKSICVKKLIKKKQHIAYTVHAFEKKIFLKIRRLKFFFSILFCM